MNKNFDRVDLQERVIDSILEGLDYKTLVQMAYENIDAYFNTLGDADFIAEVEISHSHLIDDDYNEEKTFVDYQTGGKW